MAHKVLTDPCKMVIDPDMANLKVLAFNGSLRSGSFNKKIMLQACDELRNLQCEVTVLDLRSLELPIYDGDLEDAHGLPTGGQKLIDAILAADALLIGNPEYNGSTSGALKNAIDWATRGDKNPFVGKVTLLVGTSTGWWGSIRSNMATRLVLTHLRAVVVPVQVTIPNAEENIDEKGLLKLEAHKKLLHAGLEELVKMAKAFKH
jgi:chromate reductase, NAD(P)H dehydrogenase (quinone)